MFVAVDGQFAGLLAVSDTIKDSTPEAVRALHEMGLRIIMLTGDNERTARTVAESLGIDEFAAGVRPEDVTVHPATGVRDGNTVTARADVVETLGSEIFVYLTCGPHNIVARMEVPEYPLTVGQTLEMDLRMSKTHIFDKETSRTIV